MSSQRFIPPPAPAASNFPMPPPAGKQPAPPAAPTGSVQQIQSGLLNLSMGSQQSGSHPVARGGSAPQGPAGLFQPPGAASQDKPPVPGGFQPPLAPGQGQFQPPPAPGQGQFQPPAPGQFQPPPAPGQFQPPAPGQFQPPPAPGQFQPPPAPGQFQPPAPGPPGMFQPQQHGGMGPPGGAGFPAVFQPQRSSGPPGSTSHGPPALNTGPSSQFYAQAPTHGQMNQLANGPQHGAGMAMSAPMNEHIDYSIKIPDRLFRDTASKLPQTASQGAMTKIPFGGIIRPLAPCTGDSDELDVPTVQPGTAGIIRCKRCRTYMNAFVTWLEFGRRWRCNICAQLNDCPSAYFCHLDDQGLRQDRFDRPELSQAAVEFVAPAEYMVRPPQEPTYFFVLDVSATAVRSGMIASAAKAIKASLNDLPGRGRTRIGFVTFDNSVHYYNLASDLVNPQMLVVSDLKELFVPLPDNLLVNLEESRAVVESFLDSLPEMFNKNPVASQSCLGPALKAAFTVMKQIGGKMCVFQSIMPNVGDGALKPRDAPGVMGTPNEIKILKPEMSWYKDTAIEFSRQQICVDMYLFPYQYMDFASLGELPKFTAGSLFSYVNFNYQKDSKRFEDQVVRTLTQHTALEAVMRIRCTKGMRITNFYGNFYIRGTDLLALPNCNTDSVFGFDLGHDEQNIAVSHITIQAALLYTSSEGERRIRVMTHALPVTSRNSDIFASVNTEATCSLMARQALELGMKTGLDQARMRLQQICMDIIRAAKSGDKRTVSGYSVPPPGGSHPGGSVEGEEQLIPENLQLLPLYTLALMKNVAFRGGTDVHPDERIQAHHVLNRLWCEATKHFIYPQLFSIHTMDQKSGLTSEEQDNGRLTAGRNNILLPPVVSLSIDGLSSDGVYLLNNGIEFYLWVGRNADMNVISALFGVHTLDDIDPNQVELIMSGDPFASRLGAIVEALREDVDGSLPVAPKINVVREGDTQMEFRFYWFLIEDRASFQGGTFSYEEFMHFVNNPTGPGAPAGTMGAPRGPPGGPMGNAGRSMIQSHQQGPPPPAIGPGSYNQGAPPPAMGSGSYNHGPPPPAMPSSGSYNQGPLPPSMPPSVNYNQGPRAQTGYGAPTAQHGSGHNTQGPPMNGPAAGSSYNQGAPGGGPSSSSGYGPPMSGPPQANNHHPPMGGPPPASYNKSVPSQPSHHIPPSQTASAPPPRQSAPPPPGRAVAVSAAPPPPPPGRTIGAPPPPPPPR